MSKIEVIEKTVHEVGDINNEYGSLIVGKTECGGYAWAIENYDGESWQLIPESLYIELVKFNSASHVVQAIGVIGGGV